jgi:hypothetical protein
MLTKTNDDQVIMTNRTYDWSKKLVQIWLPAVSSLYFGLGQMWGWPHLDKIPGSIALITVFLGVVLNVSHNRYKNSDEAVDGDVVVTQQGNRTVASLEFHHDDAPVVLENKQTIKFRVRERPLTVEDIEEVEIDEEP